MDISRDPNPRFDPDRVRPSDSIIHSNLPNLSDQVIQNSISVSALSSFNLGTYITAMNFSADGSKLFVVDSLDSLHIMHEDDTGKYKEFTIKGFSDNRDHTHAVFSPDSSRVVSGLYGNEISIIDLTKPPLYPIIAHLKNDSGVWGAAISPDGKYLAAGLFNSVSLRDLSQIENGVPREVGHFRGYYHEFSPLHGFSLTMNIQEFSPDGSKLLCGGPRGWLWLLDVENRGSWFSDTKMKKLFTFNFDKAVEAVSFSPAQDKLAVSVSGGEICILDLPLTLEIGKMQFLARFQFPKNHLPCIQFDDTGNQLLVSGGTISSGQDWKGVLYRIDLAPNREAIFLQDFQSESGHLEGRFSPDGKRWAMVDFEGNLDIKPLRVS